MTLTTTLSTVTTASRGTLPSPAGAQTGVMAGDFAGSFAKANADAGPGPTPPSPTADLARGAFPQTAAPPPAQNAARQEWAATGKGLPIPVLAGATAVAWPGGLVGPSPEAQPDSSPVVPAEAVIAAAIGTPTTPRPAATVVRPAPVLRPARPTTGTDQEVEAGDDDEGAEQAPPTPGVIDASQDTVIASLLTSTPPVAAASTVSDSGTTDRMSADDVLPEIAGPARGLARAQNGRRNKGETLPISPVRADPIPQATAAPATPTVVGLAPSMRLPLSATAISEPTTGLASGLPQQASAPSAPPRAIVDNGAIASDDVSNAVRPSLATSAQPISEASPHGPVGAAMLGNAPARPTERAGPTMQVTGIVAPATSPPGSPMEAATIQPAPSRVGTPFIATGPGNSLQSAGFARDTATTPAQIAQSPTGLETRAPAPVQFDAMALTPAPRSLASTAANVPLPFTVPLPQPIMAAAAPRARLVTPTEATTPIAPASSVTATPLPMATATATATGVPALVSPGLAIGLLPPAGTEGGVMEAGSTPASPLIVGTPRWTSTGATTPIALAVAQPATVQPQPGTVASAAQVFGAAIQAATKTRDAEKAGLPDTVSLSAMVAPAQHIPAPPAQQAPLDMREDRWPHAMIERIDTLRDAANATDTRIRLIPDALGAIDVTVKTTGDTVHVHFNAEQAATRTLLADAQPQLTELAEARGLKLGQGAPGDAGAGSNAGQQRAPTTPQTPNRTTAPSRAMIADITEDTRIA